MCSHRQSAGLQQETVTKLKTLGVTQVNRGKLMTGERGQERLTVILKLNWLRFNIITYYLCALIQGQIMSGALGLGNKS